MPGLSEALAEDRGHVLAIDDVASVARMRRPLGEQCDGMIDVKTWRQPLAEMVRDVDGTIRKLCSSKLIRGQSRAVFDSYDVGYPVANNW